MDVGTDLDAGMEPDVAVRDADAELDAEDEADADVIVPEAEPTTVALEATDVNDDELTFELRGLPDNGELTDFDEVVGTVIYTPNGGFTGSDAFTFAVGDGELDSNEATVTLSVNGAPGFVSLPPAQSALADRTLGPLAVTIDDPDDELSEVTLTATSDRQDIVRDESIGLVGTGAERFFTLLTEPDVAGVVTVTLELSDDSAAVTADILVHVGVTHDLDDADQPGSIRRALDMAQSGDTVTFDPDHFNEGASEAQRTITLQSPLVFNQDLTLQGPGEDLLTLSGNNAVRVIFVATGVTLGLHELTLSNGRAVGGGAIRNDGGVVSVTNSTLVNNVAESRGGAISNDPEGVVILTNCALSGNSGTGGGAVENDGELTLINSTLSGNSTTEDNGGGIDNSGQTTLINSTLSGNVAISGGGGIWNSSGQVTVVGSTLFANRAYDGGGIGNTEPGAVLLRATIVAGNLGGSDGSEPNEVYTESGKAPLDAASAYNLVGDAASSDILEDGVSGNVVGVDWTTVLDPTLIGNGGPTQTQALLSSSPAVDRIPEVHCADPDGNAIETDQRGEPRPSPPGGACDIGAFERQPSDS